MKNPATYLVGFLFMILPSCEIMQHQDPEIRFNAVFVDDILFSDCLSDDTLGYGSFEITSKPYNYLMFHALNTEFCCSTDSVLIGINQPGDTVDIEIYDMGPYAYCFCDHDLYFTAGPFKKKLYNFRIIESIDAYARDTFIFSLDLSGDIDTILFPLDTTSIFSSTDTTGNPTDTTIINPSDTTLIKPQLLNTVPGGCNIDTSEFRGQDQDDVSWSKLKGDSALIFAGFNYQCCAPFLTEVSMEDGTIIIRIIDTCDPPYNDCYCRCNCYYTFEFTFLLSPPFRVYPYKIYIADPKHGGEYLFWEDFISGPV